MQNFDDLDIEGRNPSHLSEADKEKVILEKCFVKILLFIMLKNLLMLKKFSNKFTKLKFYSKYIVIHICQS